MGDVNAVQEGKVGKRIVRGAAGNATGRTLPKLIEYGVEASHICNLPYLVDCGTIWVAGA